jgi:hypothetical protein
LIHAIRGAKSIFFLASFRPQLHNIYELFAIVNPFFVICGKIERKTRGKKSK